MEAAQQQLLRQIVKRVHPDLFHAHPFEMKVNSESLQVGWMLCCMAKF